MKVLLCHNHYQQPGGEDRVFADEAALLESQGHTVLRFTLHNDAINAMGRWQVAWKTLWNREVFARLRELIRRERPAVMHCTNTFPLISPAAYYAARRERVPVVQSLHNYRMFCPGAVLLRNSRVCEDCLKKWLPWPGVVHACYRHSRSATAVVAATFATHRLLGTWTRVVDRYIALSQHSRAKFIEAGLPAERISWKPNFIHPDPGPGTGRGGYAVFVGRLSGEKGIPCLLEAWSRLTEPVPLKIAGDGPQAEQVRAAAARDARIEWLGWRPAEEIAALVGEAGLLVMPSLCYETFGRAVAEAFARGTPVIASRLGAMGELVADGRTGLLFEPGNADDLARCVRRLWAQLPATTMRQAARQEYEEKYTAERNYRMLMNIYDDVLARGCAPRSFHACDARPNSEIRPGQPSSKEVFLEKEFSQCLLP